MNRKHDAAKSAKQMHEKPVDEHDMQASMTSETPESERIEDEGEPFGDNFA